MKLLKRVSILAVLITVIAVFAGCGKAVSYTHLTLPTIA